MKQETKEIIDWLEDFLWEEKRNCKGNCDDFERFDKAIGFINSIPEIESHLCSGGYIQDRNGTPCCHGDRIKFKFSQEDFADHWKDRYAWIEYGSLKYDIENKRFIILFGKDINGYDWIDWNGAYTGCEWFEKADDKKGA